MKLYKLDKEEQIIENNLEKFLKKSSSAALKSKLKNAAKTHLNSKRLVSLRITEEDIEAMKIKASKAGLPYQTYIKMIIHRDACSL